MAGSIRELNTGSKEAVRYMVREITHICKDMKSREPGSEGEREAAGYMADVLRETCGCTDVKVETFEEHPSSFYGYFYISAALNILSAVCFFFLPWLCVVTGCISVLLFLLHFVLYKRILDPLFPKKESINVTAVRPCSKEVRQRVFLNGHTDAAWEFPLNYYFGGVVFEIPGAMATLGAFYYIAIGICILSGAGKWAHIAGLCGLIFVPFFLLLAFTYNPKRVVDGANDNLSGCYIGIALLKEMEQRGIILEHTEIGVLLTGSEEAGLRGAKAWAKKHKDDYQDVPTYIIGFDTIHDPKHLMVNRRDLNSTIHADRELCEWFRNAAKEAGVPCKTGVVPLFGGSTDATAFLQEGFRAVTITGLNHVLEDYYHTRKDTYDNLNEEGLENCYKATVCLLDRMEREE